MSGGRPFFIVDEAQCTGCQACAVACRDRAHLDESVAWLRVEAVEGGQYPRPSLLFRVVHCHHCQEPACATVCPTDAIQRDGTGLMQVIAEACVRCGACESACPFGAIALPTDVSATKCDGCPDEIAQGWEPTCVRACPMRALRFVAEGQPIPHGRAKDITFDDHGTHPLVLYLVRAPAPQA